MSLMHISAKQGDADKPSFNNCSKEAESIFFQMRHAERHGLDNKTTQNVYVFLGEKRERKTQKLSILTIKVVRGLDMTWGNVSNPQCSGAIEATGREITWNQWIKLWGQMRS